MANNKTKYINIDPEMRDEYQKKWNAPVYWPLVFVLLVIACLLLPAYIIYRRIERSTAL